MKKMGVNFTNIIAGIIIFLAYPSSSIAADNFNDSSMSINNSQAKLQKSVDWTKIDTFPSVPVNDYPRYLTETSTKMTMRQATTRFFTDRN